MFEGQWLGDKKDGEGILIAIDGSTYEGSFVNDVR